MDENAKQFYIYTMNSSKINEVEYHAALASKLLSPKFAAVYLKSTEGYLAKKRRKDKKEGGRRSIPYMGSAKGLKYPLEALTAYKANDWEKLAKIREKMNFPDNLLKEKEEKQSELDEKS